jgi:arabinogalactan oligomer/maltooligosaccharide transport system permease protein
VAPPSFLVGLAFALAPFVIVFAISLALREPRVGLMTLVAAVLLFVTIFAYRQWAMSSLTAGARVAEQRFTERVRNEAAIAARVAPGADANAKTWDADLHRVPHKFDPVRAAEGERHAVANASYGIGVLSLLILLFIALGFFGRTTRAAAEHRQAYAFVAPAMIGMLILVLFPFIYGVVLSFTSQNVYSVNKPLTDIWVGVQNYGEILGDFNPIKQTDAGRQANYSNFYYTLLFTILWTVSNVAIGTSVGLLLALILNTKNLRFRTVYRVLLVLPWALPNYISSLIFKGMFHQQFGAINQALQLFGMQPIAWFDRPVTSFLAVLLTNSWLSFPFMMVISLGALQSIPADLYEAARVDGASRWQQFAGITLPSLKPALVPAVILSVIWTFNMFNVIYLVSAGMPAGSTEILITQAYKFAFEQYRYGYAAAYSTIIFAILLIYGVFQNRVSRATESIA